MARTKTNALPGDKKKPAKEKADTSKRKKHKKKKDNRKRSSASVGGVGDIPRAIKKKKINKKKQTRSKERRLYWRAKKRAEAVKEE